MVLPAAYRSVPRRIVMSQSDTVPISTPFPKGPNTAKLVHLLEERPIPVDSVLKEMVSVARIRDAKDLPTLSKIGEMSEFLDEILAEPALALMPCWGREGIDVLYRIARGDSFHSDTAVTHLVAIAHGDKIASTHGGKDINRFDVPYAITPDLQQHALMRVRELVLDDFGTPEKQERLLSQIHLLGFSATGSPRKMAAQYLLASVFESRLAINRYVIEEYEHLLDRVPQYESELQKFLVKHPVFIDPLAVEVYDRRSLGDDLITDFVVRRITNDYLLVEIEKSSDPLFTASDDFTHQVTHAVGQVSGFQSWVSDNIAYAQTKLPGIRRPGGLVIIGRDAELNERRRRKLLEENFSRGQHVQIVTFDHLLEQAKTIYRNMLQGPPIS